MSGYQGSGGISGCATGIPIRAGSKWSGMPSSRNKYKDVKSSEQKNTSGQKRVARKIEQHVTKKETL